MRTLMVLQRHRCSYSPSSTFIYVETSDVEACMEQVFATDLDFNKNISSIFKAFLVRHKMKRINAKKAEKLKPVNVK